MEDDGCSLTFVKMTNPNIVKAKVTSSCVTHPLDLKIIYVLIGGVIQYKVMVFYM